MTSSMQASWMASVKRMTSAEVAFDDLEADDTLAEDTTSSASATVSSNPSTSSSCSLPRKSSHPMTMRKSSSLVPRPSNEKISRNVEHSHGNELPTKKIQKFHLDTETVREIESLDSSNSDSLIPTFRSFDPTTHAQKINNFFPSKIPSRLPRKIYNEPSFPGTKLMTLAGFRINNFLHFLSRCEWLVPCQNRGASTILSGKIGQEASPHDKRWTS